MGWAAYLGFRWVWALDGQRGGFVEHCLRCGISADCRGRMRWVPSLHRNYADWLAAVARGCFNLCFGDVERLIELRRDTLVGARKRTSTADRGSELSSSTGQRGEAVVRAFMTGKSE